MMNGCPFWIGEIRIHAELWSEILRCGPHQRAERGLQWRAFERAVASASRMLEAFSIKKDFQFAHPMPASCCLQGNPCGNTNA